jgi:SNF2 family DNA or RNA helicase
MGTGKTSATLSALDYLYAFGAETMPTLVLAPLRVARSTWPDEVKKWSNFQHMEVQPILGTQSQRIVALNNPNASIFTINYENIPWLVEWYKNNPAPWPFGTVVADESTKLKGYRTRQGGLRTKLLAEVAHTKVRRFIELSGTPAPNGLKDLWGQSWFLDGGHRLGRSFNAFQQRWFQSVPGSTGFSNIRPLPYAQEEIQDKLRDLCLTIRAEDYFDIDKPIVRDIEVQLPPKSMVQYRTMEKEMFAEIEDEGVEAFNAASRTMKCQQIANGFAYTGAPGEWVGVHDAKLQALDDIIEEAAGAPILVAYNFKADAQRIMKAFPSARMLDQNPKTLQDWNAGKVPVLLAHPASAGHGLNMQDGGNILVYFGVNWNMEEHDQILERIGPTRQKQSGHNRAVFVYRIIATGTIDEDILERLVSKRDVQDVLLDAMKKKRK